VIQYYFPLTATGRITQQPWSNKIAFTYGLSADGISAYLTQVKCMYVNHKS
jgi:hypothetical protein